MAPPPLTAGTPPEAVAVAIQGDPTPAGGKFGLAGRNSAGAVLLGATNQVVFFTDILDLNATGLFFWTPEGTITPVVTSMDSLPPGANTVLRSARPSSSDEETLVRVFHAGGQAGRSMRALLLLLLSTRAGTSMGHPTTKVSEHPLKIWHKSSLKQ